MAAIRYSLPKFRTGQRVYLYLSDGSALLVKIEEVYMIDKLWYYDIDCSNYAYGMSLENVHENMLGCGINAKMNNVRLSSQLMRQLSDML